MNMRAWIFSFLALMSCDGGAAPVDLKLGAEQPGPLRAAFEQGYIRLERSGRASEVPLDREQLESDCAAICQRFEACGFPLGSLGNCVAGCYNDLSDELFCATPVVEAIDCLLNLVCDGGQNPDVDQTIYFACAIEIAELANTPSSPVVGADVCEFPNISIED